MVFSSSVFLFLFLPLVLAAYFAVPTRLRNVVLLTASLLFYAWGEKGFVLLMLASIALNWLMAFWIRASNRRWVFAVAIASNVGLLIFFKYTNLLASSLSDALVPFGVVTPAIKSIHLPIGISFFTFETIAYLADVRSGKAQPERNPINFGLFMTLFPHLIAGPVVRYRDLAASLASRTTSSAQFASGVRRFLVGLAKKVLIANTVGRVADDIFAFAPGQLAPSAAWLGAVCYALQIYFDFSGYSDMAIGLGRLFGFELVENFDHPYIATSMSDFWRRWHISLSTWFRDYVYIPLGGSRRGALVTIRNLLVVFALCGLWHGASWVFLAWSLYHGLFLCLERLGLGRLLGRMPSAFGHGYTLLAVLGGWVLFRSPTFEYAFGYYSAMLGLTKGSHGWTHHINRELLLAVWFGVLACMPLIATIRARASTWRLGPTMMAIGRIAVLAGLFAACTIRLAADTYSPFIYYRF